MRSLTTKRLLAENWRFMEEKYEIGQPKGLRLEPENTHPKKYL
jgi:hypothetical protein